MPQLPFIQTMAVAAFVAIVLVVLAMPIGAWRGARAGQRLLRVSLVGVIAVFIACLVWGSSTGDLALFNAHMGLGAWVQMGAFFAIVYFTGYRFISSYLADKAAEEGSGRDHRGPSGGEKGAGGPDA